MDEKNLNKGINSWLVPLKNSLFSFIKSSFNLVKLILFDGLFKLKNKTITTKIIKIPSNILNVFSYLRYLIRNKVTNLTIKIEKTKVWKKKEIFWNVDWCKESL